MLRAVRVLFRIICLLALLGAVAPLSSCSQAGGLASGAATAAQSAPRSLWSTFSRTMQSAGRTVTGY